MRETWSRVRWLVPIALLSTTSLACREAPTRARASASLPSVDDGELRESARETLDKNCGACHTRGLTTALPRALAVFDLTEVDFAHAMTKEQLDEAARRLDRPFAPSPNENEERPIKLAQGERERFGRYVALERARRDVARP